MSVAPQPASIAPTLGTQRLATLDVMRGISVLGILLINVQWFAMIPNAYMNPHMGDTLSPINYIIWLIVRVLADFSFLTLFSMLFGVGVLLMTTRGGEQSLRLHLRRMAVLLMLGFLHGYGLWYGDILYFYAICGTLVYVARGWGAWRLLTIGLLLIAIQSGASLLLGWSAQFWPKELIAGFHTSWCPGPQQVAETLAVYRGSWLHQMHTRVWATLSMEISGLLGLHIWRVTGSMLIGMALYKMNLLSGQRSIAWAKGFMAFGLLLGAPMVLYGVHRQDAVGWDAVYCNFIGSQYLTWGSLAITAGWVGIALYLCQRQLLPRVTARLAAVGQLSLTNYLTQTILCTTIFYGHGLGLYGRVDHLGQMLIVLAIWVVQLILSPLWLRYFEYGPFEWLWRCLSYKRRLPLRRCPVTPSAP